MTDRPIIFSGAMVRALLDGTKTQTRRVLKPQPTAEWEAPPLDRLDTRIVPYRPGDRLYVRENFYLTDDGHDEYAVYAADEIEVARHINNVGNVAARGGLSEEWLRRHIKLRPSIHMPRWASRLTLIVDDVLVERVQDITERDAIAEGCHQVYENTGRYGAEVVQTARSGFCRLWSNLNAKRGYGWLKNPWVVAITFRVINQNIDQIAA